MSVRAALLTVLRSVVETGDGEAPEPTPQRYAVLYASPGSRTAGDVAGTYDLTEHRFQVTSVGSTPAQVDWVAQRTENALLGLVLTVPGLSCGPIEGYEPDLIRRDDDNPNGPVFYGTRSYVLHAART